MFKLIDERRAWITVSFAGLTEEGAAVTNELDCYVTLLDRDEFSAAMDVDTGLDQEEFVQKVVQDWRGIESKIGKPLEFNEGNLKKLINVPNFTVGFVRCYLAAWGGQPGVREKNSVASEEASPKADIETSAAS